MTNLTHFQLNRRWRAVQLALATGLALVLLLFLLWGLQAMAPALVGAGTLYVDGANGSDSGDCQNPAASCQSVGYALSQVVDGDEIWVAAGTYSENLDITGTMATLRGGYTVSGTQWLAGVGTTIVDGNELDRVFLVHGGSDLTLEDMTISGGVAPEAGCGGGGVLVTNGSATLRRTIVQGNKAVCTSGQSGGGAGGGLNAFADEGPATLYVEDSYILDNQAGDHGSAVAMDQVTVVLTNVVIAGNNYNQLAVHMSDFTLVNGTIADNATNGSPILDFDSVSSIVVRNSIIWNSGYIACGGGGGTCDITYSDVEGGWTGTGNIDADPNFAGGGDYHLLLGSPAIDAGTNTGAPDHDLDQAPRPQDGDGDGTATADLGAYEFEPTQLYLPVVLSNFGS